MRNNEQIIGEAVRIEYDEKTGDLYLVFKIKDEKYKQEVKKNWTEDIEYRIVERNLVKDD